MSAEGKIKVVEKIVKSAKAFLFGQEGFFFRRLQSA